MRDTFDRFRPRKSLGQNFLVNQGAADTIVVAFDPRPDDLVLEIGPGRGVLTERLAGRVKRLVAVEIDPDLAVPLREGMRHAASVEVVQSDILEVDLAALLHDMGATTSRRARVIANLPYSIATAVILRLLGEGGLLADLLVLVQREVAERIASPHGRKSYGGLSVLCQAQARVEILLRLRPGSFRPIPKVESELVRLTLRPSDGTSAAGEDADRVTLQALLRTAFGQRRKTLLNNLARLPARGGAPLGSAAAAEWIRSVGLEPGIRPEDVPVAGFQALQRTLPAL